MPEALVLAALVGGEARAPGSGDDEGGDDDDADGDNGGNDGPQSDEQVRRT